MFPSQTASSSALSERLDEVGSLIGGTPLYPIRNAFQHDRVKLYAKLEWHQLGQSVKARPAFQIIHDAVHRGELHPGKRLLDASSGNTGIAYAAIGSALGVPVTICLPENASQERKQILKAYGAEVILTSPFEATEGAQRKARELYAERPDLYYYADQYSNPSNWQAHYFHTSREIYQQTQGQVTHFVAGLGTTGSFTGTVRKLKEINPSIQAIALQPETALHGLEGWKHLETADVPAIYDASLADNILEVDTVSAYETLKLVADTEGLLISPSAAANLLGAMRVAEHLEEGVVVTVFADDASKYSEVIDNLF
ncbi:MAG: cysteine synthase family protein [Bacteroidota bacterium]